MTHLLASVRDAEEARIALKASIGLLDLKNPENGALGAVDIEIVRECVPLTKGICPISATIGDLPLNPAMALEKIAALAKCGVDYIKVGMFNPEYLTTYPAACKNCADKTALVAVLFADRFPVFEGPVRLLARAGFTGVMLDTADKKSGTLCDCVSIEQLQAFVEQTRQLSLLCGLAGSLRQEDISKLTALKPDYLGFRTALCKNEQRNGKLSLTALQTLLNLMPSATCPIKAAS